MGNVIFPSFQLFGNDYDPSWSKEDPRLQLDGTGFMDLLSPVFGQESVRQNAQENISNDWMQGNSFCQPEDVQPRKSELISKDVKENQSSVSLASWDLLNNYGKGFKMPREENLNEMMSDKSIPGQQRLSVEGILMVAGKRFIEFSTNRVDGISMLIHPYGSSLSALSFDDARDVELTHHLLAAAENVAFQQFDLASKLISRCLWYASGSGSPLQRIAFYFAEALQEKINRESGNKISVKNKKNSQHKGLALGTNTTFLACHQALPFGQVVQIAAVQAIIENVKTGGKIHLIDLQIRSGIQWTALMQGLAECCSIQHLKITAVGTSDQLYIEETGKRLQNFAVSLNLPFSFQPVYLTDMREFKESLLNVEADETVVVYSFMMLRSMISKPDVLENLMREITTLKPALMIVSEVEANHNSPSFIDRFVEALLYYSAYFDCLEESTDRNNKFRTTLEGTYFGQGILNMVAYDDQERVTRNVKLDVWRAFFTRFGMMEIELSESSKYQASLVLKQFAKGSSCTLECDGKGFTVGWKGTPFNSLTAWRFS